METKNWLIFRYNSSQVTSQQVTTVNLSARNRTSRQTGEYRHLDCANLRLLAIMAIVSNDLYCIIFAQNNSTYKCLYFISIFLIFIPKFVREDDSLVKDARQHDTNRMEKNSNIRVEWSLRRPTWYHQTGRWTPLFSWHRRYLVSIKLIFLYRAKKKSLFESHCLKFWLYLFCYAIREIKVE